MTRRDFLRRSLAAGVALPSAAAILAACGEGGGPGAGSDGGTPEVRFGTLDNPAELQLFDDNPAIASGLEPEAGPLVIYNWEQYVYKQSLKDFGKEFGVEVKEENFYNMEEAIQKIQTGQVTFDIFVPTIDVLPKLVAAKLVQPLNLEYLPNLSNVWPTLQDPFYDLGSRYSVPYTTYTTGIGWRTDILPLEVDEVAAMTNPYDVFWEQGPRGKTGIYDVTREALQLGAYHVEGRTADPNTPDLARIDAAKQALIELFDAVDGRYTIEGAYSGIPEGKFGLHQAWSGDMIGTPWYTSDTKHPEVDMPFIRYYWPARDGFGGIIDNDMLVVPKGATNPVLAHAFLNYILDNDHGMKNFSWLGYQPPLTALDPQDVIANGWPGLEGTFSWENGGRWDNLTTAILTAEDFDLGARAYGLPIEVETLWTDAFAEFKAGVS